MKKRIAASLLAITLLFYGFQYCFCGRDSRY